MRHNADRTITHLASDPIELPNRGARVLEGYTLLGRKIDVVETSRGCTFDCSFCSIIEMRGRNFHTFGIERVLADISDARRRGAEAIFLVDDNITLDVHRFEALCHAIIESGLQNIEYFVQAMTAPLAQHGATLAPLMRQAGFRYVFLGIENVLDEDLVFLKARAKNAKRQDGRTIGNATIDAIDHLHRHGMFVVGGLIVGNPDDTRESIEANLEFAKRYVDWPYIQHPTPYPAYADDERVPRSRVDCRRGRGALRRDDGGGADRACRRDGRGVSPLACRALDQGAAFSERVRPQPRVRPAERLADAGAHVCRQHDSFDARTRKPADGLRTIPRRAPSASAITFAAEAPAFSRRRGTDFKPSPNISVCSAPCAVHGQLSFGVATCCLSQHRDRRFGVHGAAYLLTKSTYRSKLLTNIG